MLGNAVIAPPWHSIRIPISICAKNFQVSEKSAFSLILSIIPSHFNSYPLLMCLERSVFCRCVALTFFYSHYPKNKPVLAPWASLANLKLFIMSKTKVYPKSESETHLPETGIVFKIKPDRVSSSSAEWFKQVYPKPKILLKSEVSTT